MREAKRLRSRRIRAVLAGGLVFGVGAAMTLAAWNDSESATSTFTAGRFGIVGSTDGTNFAEHNPTAQPPTSAATLSFSVAATAMVPGMTTYALFSVKTTATPTSVAGTLALVSGTQSGTLASGLTVGVRLIPTAAPQLCNATTFGASAAIVIPSGSALTTNGAPSSTVPQVVNAAGVGQLNYCFAVTLKPDAGNELQGTTATKTWQIVGTSS